MKKLSNTDKKQLSDLDVGELQRGVEAELEHTSDPDAALKIAVEKLSADAGYYKKLRHFEEGRAASKISAGEISKAFFQPG